MPTNHKPEREQAPCPLVTVVMSVYNSADTVGRAVSAILNQSYPNTEFIICDDASTDGTWEKLEPWAADRRVRLLRNARNLGPGASRNRCFACANGQFVALMDADDDCLPSRLSEEMAVLSGRPEIAFVGTRGEYFSESDGALGRYYWFLSEPRSADFLMTLPFVHASLLFRREVLQRLGGYGESGTLRRAEDYDLLMRAYAAGYAGCNLPKALYRIRICQPYHRQKYKDRVNECAVKWRGFARLGLMPRGIIYAIKPLFVDFLPVKLLNKLKERYYSRWK